MNNRQDSWTFLRVAIGIALVPHAISDAAVSRTHRLAVSIGLLMLTACGGGSGTPTTPTPPTGGARTLSIAGTTLLTPGVTSRLSVTIVSGSGTTTPSAVTWQTRDTSIATVSADGLLTGVSVGMTFVNATADGLFAQLVVTVQSATGTNGGTISACASITSPGTYALDRDLVGSATCLSFTSVAGVHLDCQGHSVSGLALTNVTGATVQGCTVAGRMTLTSVTSVTVSRTTVQNDLTIKQSSSVVVSDCTLMPTLGVTVDSGTGVQLLRDTITTTSPGYGMVLSSGMNNQVLQSTFTGGYTGVGNTGADDAVLLFNETGDTIQGNTISSFYDAAIEGLDGVSNTTISNNILSNLGFTGIGSYWCTNWASDTIQGNQISNAPNLGYFEYTVDTPCGKTFPAPAFTDNKFIGNVFRNPTPNANGAGLVIVMPPSTVSGNLLQGNDFGSYNGPQLSPLDGFIDGGGNICGPLNPAISNFACTGSAPRQTGRFTASPRANPRR